MGKRSVTHQSERDEDLAYEALLAEETFILEVQMRIQAILNAQNITQAELARKLGVGESYISQMFGASARNLTLRTVARVLRALGTVPVLSTRGLHEPEVLTARQSPEPVAADGTPWGEVVMMTRPESRSRRTSTAARHWAEYDEPLPELAAAA